MVAGDPLFFAPNDPDLDVTNINHSIVEDSKCDIKEKYDLDRSKIKVTADNFIYNYISGTSVQNLLKFVLSFISRFVK